MKVEFSKLAELDFGNLVMYINDELQNPIAARNVATKILLRSKALADFPEMGAALEIADSRLSGYRYLVVDNYLIIYKITDCVNVLRILYARSDFMQLLR